MKGLEIFFLILLVISAKSFTEIMINGFIEFNKE